MFYLNVIVITKRPTESQFWKSKCACLPNYRNLSRKNIINKLGVSSENEQ